MQTVISAALVLVAVIHLLPLSGVLSRERLARLYGIAFDDPNAEILMRHRAVLFGLLGVFLLYAAFCPMLQLAALVAAGVSVLSFLWLARSVGGYNAILRRVVVADRVALVALLVGAGAYALKSA